MLNALIPERLVDAKCLLGEGPIWSETEGRLHWTDIDGKFLHSYAPEVKEHRSAAVPAKVSAMTLQPDGSRLLFMENGRLDLRQTGSTRTLRDGMPEIEGTRFNDVCATPEGSVLCTTMPSEGHPSRLYLLLPDLTLRLLLDEGGMFNGMGFTPDGRSVYVTDSIPGTITLYDFDEDLRNPRLFAREPDETINPDGLAVDAEGFVWSARYGAGLVLRLGTDGREVARIELPCPHVASLAFGGAALEDLYVVTGRQEGDPDGAGALFRVRPPALGLPRPFSRISID